MLVSSDASPKVRLADSVAGESCAVVGRQRFGKPPTASRSEVVVTAHGWMATRRSLARLHDELQFAGYRTINWSYPSYRGGITSHAAAMAELLCELIHDTRVRRIHLVTHSMGGIVARAALLLADMESRWPRKCGRMVMMAPPNGGSRLTRIPLGPFKRFFPQIVELSEHSESLVNQLPPLRRIEVGIIAAARDFVVQTAATHLAGQADHAVLATTHQRLASDPVAIEMSLRFLAEGRLHAHAAAGRRAA